MRMAAKLSSALTLMLVAMLCASPSNAAKPEPWQLDFQPAATPVMERIAAFHDFLMVVITIITVFIFFLLLYCIFWFNERVNPEPSRVSHNTSLEIIWTVVPVLILVMIAVPSFRLLRDQTTVPKVDMTIKAIGHQWYWEYEYSDENFAFDSLMIDDKDIKEGQLRLLSVDNPLYVPVNKTVRVIVTASDVLHAFAVPAFGSKVDAVPGRINETWFRVTKIGTYYGQCSELCGSRHAFMPIEVRVVTQRDYNRWLRGAKRTFSNNDTPQQESFSHARAR